MKTTQLLSIVIGSILLSSCFDDGKTTFQTPNIPTPDGYSLVWSDEFSDPLLDIGRWQYETGDGTDYGLPVGWGNDEKQIYTVSAENSGITKSDGEMAFFIRANKTASGGYTSAKLTSKNFSSIRFRRIDIRAKMPQGQCIWPAIWMLGDNIDEETIGQNIDPSVMNHAIKEGFTDLGNGTVVVFGGGGEPTVKTSEEAVDGAMSLVFDFPGGHWGGGYIELESPVDLSAYTSLKFSLYKPSELVNAEIKLESPKTNATVYLKDYTGADVGKGFVEYTIPFADFTDLDVSEIKIPFSMWNPQDASDAFVTAEVLIDNLHFSK